MNLLSVSRLLSFQEGQPVLDIVTMPEVLKKHYCLLGYVVKNLNRSPFTVGEKRLYVLQKPTPL